MKQKKILRTCNVWVIGILLLVAVLTGGSATAMAAAAGAGPDDALVPASQWQPLEGGENHWYAFQYMGDDSQIQVQLETVPADGASFTVWTPEEARQWRAGSEVEPVGRGSPSGVAPDPSLGGTLVWSGRFNTPGTYYVVVEHAGSRPAATYYLLNVSGDGVSLTTPADAVATSATTTPKETQPKVAASSEPTGKLAFQTAVGGHIYTINADGSALQQITDGMDPSWSPDGGQIAFIRWQDPRGVWVIDTATGNEWRVFDWSDPRWTSWSPDGEEILFSRVTGGRLDAQEFCFRGFCFSFPASPHWIMGIVDVGDGTFREPPPPDSRTSRAPSWSPDGNQVVFADVQGLRIQNEDRSVSYQVTDDAKDTSPIWSPDGSQVAFVRRQHDHWEIYVVDAFGGNLRRLTETPRKPTGEVGSSASPAWSPDGQQIAFLTDRSGDWEIWVMAADGSRERPMFESELDDLTLDYASVGERAISWTR